MSKSITMWNIHNSDLASLALGVLDRNKHRIPHGRMNSLMIETSHRLVDGGVKVFLWDIWDTARGYNVRYHG